MGVNNKRLTLKTLKQKLLKLHLITYFGVHVWGIPLPPVSSQDQALSSASPPGAGDPGRGAPRLS